MSLLDCSSRLSVVCPLYLIDLSFNAATEGVSYHGNRKNLDSIRALSGKATSALKFEVKPAASLLQFFAISQLAIGIHSKQDFGLGSTSASLQGDLVILS